MEKKKAKKAVGASSSSGRRKSVRDPVMDFAELLGKLKEIRDLSYELRK